MKNVVIGKPQFDKRIGILMGGCSSERKISLKSGTAVFSNLYSNKFNVVSIDIVSEDKKEISDKIKASEIDVAFIALHGRFGEDGKIQQILEELSIPYTGSGVKVSQLAINKIATYRRLSKNNIQVPSYFVVQKSERGLEQSVFQHFPGASVIVKPNCEGSSIGITIVNDCQNLSKALEEAFKYDDQVIVERYITGKELTVSILGDKLLPVVEIKPRNVFFDFQAKYQSGATEYIVPAQIDGLLTERIQRIAFETHKAIGCRHLSRVDLILDEMQVPYVLEINTIPGMTSTSLLPKAALASGINFTKLCLTLIKLAYDSKK